MSWIGKDVRFDVKVTIQRDQLVVDLFLDNQSEIDVFFPDVSFKSTDRGVIIDSDYLPISLNKNNVLEVNLLVEPLDSSILWATPPTFFTHKITSKGSYQRQWLLDYPVRISNKNMHALASNVNVSNGFLFNIGIIQPTLTYRLKELQFKDKILYEFGSDATRFQMEQQIMIKNKEIRVKVE